MRQVFLVIVLVGAAFGGGALVSGPGFRWAQEHLLDYMGLKDGGEIDSLELTPPPDASPKKPDPSAPLVGPAAVAAQAEKAKPADSPAPPPVPQPKATEPFTEPKQAPAELAQAPAATPTPEPAKSEPPALLGALTSVLSQAAPAAGTTPAGSTRPADDAVSPAPAPLDPGVAPSALPALEAPGVSPSPPPSTAAPSATGGDWAEVRRKLAAAGVTRYTVEGEPGGKVVFACLIPLAGKQAVSQRFEAEGADEFQAAQAVLKRINLWRASHAAAPGSN